MPRFDPKFPLRRRRRGATALEFAVILPLLTTLVLSCVDLGRFAHSYIVVTNAARVGASFATMNPRTPETLALWQNGILQAIEQEMSGLSQFDPQALSVQTTVVCQPQQNREVQIEVSYPFRTIIAWPGLPDSLNLQQTVVMQTIRP